MQKALVVLFVIACVAYGFAGTSTASQSTTKVQSSANRLAVMDAALK